MELACATAEYDQYKYCQVTLENLTDFTGATVDETNLKQEITDQDLRDALLGNEDGGVDYEVVSPGKLRPSRDPTVSASLAVMKRSLSLWKPVADFCFRQSTSFLNLRTD